MTNIERYLSQNSSFVNAHGVPVSDDDLPEVLRADRRIEVDGTPDEINETIEKLNRLDSSDKVEGDPSAPSRIRDAATAMKFILAGNAYFTVRSIATGTRYTYRASKAKENPKYPNSVCWFVGFLSGSNNETDYSYIGNVYGGGTFRTNSKSTLPMQSKPVASFAWLLTRLVAGHMPTNVELWHEGRCGRCGRKLTVPESIEAGIGPDCAEMMGGGQ